MMFQPCPVCKDPESVDGYGETCACEECGSRFEIDPDYDYCGESYKDCSTVGKRTDSWLRRIVIWVMR